MAPARDVSSPENSSPENSDDVETSFHRTRIRTPVAAEMRESEMGNRAVEAEGRDGGSKEPAAGEESEGESTATKEMYGLETSPMMQSGRGCLLARRMRRCWYSSATGTAGRGPAAVAPPLGQSQRQPPLPPALVLVQQGQADRQCHRGRRSRSPHLPPPPPPRPCPPWPCSQPLGPRHYCL